jgi:hypothetical protein
MLELTVLLISITVLLLIIYFKDNIKLNTKGGSSHKDSQEPFQNFYLSACPSGYKSFYNNNGDTVCCDGEIIANKCLSDNQCTLNGKGITNCTELLKKLYSAKAKEYCTSSMPNYFEDKSKNIKGCMSGPLNDTMTGPQKYDQPKCLIYPSLEENINAKDSCINQKLLDSTLCFGNNCTKELVQPILLAPPIVEIGFTDSTGLHRRAFVRKSVENFLNVSNPNWKNEGLDLSRNLIIAEVAKAYYIDRTMDQKDVQF